MSNNIYRWRPRTYYILQNKTTLKKYVGQTIKSLDTYLGSGTYWKNHCISYGGYTRENIKVIWSKKFYYEEDANQWLEEFKFKYPNYYQYDNTEWANLVEENTLSNPKGNSDIAIKGAETRRKNNINTGIAISKSKLGKPNYAKSISQRNIVVAKTIDGDYVSVTKEEFNSDDLLVGVNKGSIMPARTNDYRKKVSDNNKDRIHLYNPENNNRKFVKKSELDSYLKIGYIKGIPSFKRKKNYICKNCGKITSKQNHIRWHGEKCKKLK